MSTPNKEIIIPLARMHSEEEERLNQEGSDEDKTGLSKSLEELKVDSEPSTSVPTSPRKIKVKPAPIMPKDEQEYLKDFDVLEKREGNPVLTKYSLPNSNIPERIVLVIDRAQDENCTPFSIGSLKYTPLSMLKRAISIFIKLKLAVNPEHQFAIIALNENDATLRVDFTHEIKKLVNALSAITECETEDIFDLNAVFDIIKEFPLPVQQQPHYAPEYVMRAIIFYGRSYTIPKITLNDPTEAILKHPFFICDVLMTHEPVEISNHCQKIFNILQELDQKGISYFFPVCRDLRRMHKSTGKLLAHPLQRPIQKLLKN